MGAHARGLGAVAALALALALLCGSKGAHGMERNELRRAASHADPQYRAWQDVWALVSLAGGVVGGSAELPRHNPACMLCSTASHTQAVGHARTTPSATRKSDNDVVMDNSARTAASAVAQVRAGLLVVNTTVACHDGDDAPTERNLVLQTWEMSEPSLLMTSFFCDRRVYCTNDTAANFAFCNTTGTAAQLGLLNQCRADLGAPACTPSSASDDSCESVNVTISIGEAVLVVHELVPLISSHHPKYDLDGLPVAHGLLNLNYVGWPASAFDVWTYNGVPQHLVDTQRHFFSLTPVLHSPGDVAVRLSHSALAVFSDGRTLWSMQSSVPSPRRIFNPVFHLSVCGVDLLYEFASHWQTVVSLETQCLVLPPQFFQRLMGWLPHECPSTQEVRQCVLGESTNCRRECSWGDAASIQDGDCWRCCRRCRLQESYNAAELPPLQFSLQEDAPVMNLPLASLLLDDGQTLCVEYYHEVEGYFERALQRVVLGSHFLQASAVSNASLLVDFATHRIGFHTPLPAARAPTDLCSKKAQCVGSQTYVAAENSCVDPPCSLYYFQEVDEHSKECRFTTTFQVCAFVGLVGFVAAELALFEMYRSLTATVSGALRSM